MKQLTPLDSQMLFLETPEAPNILGPLSIYDPSTAPGGKVTFKGILRNLEDRLDLAPMFRRRLVRVPLDLDEPYWVDDPHFDLEYHVRHLALPKPGDWRQLNILVSRLIARQMDPTRPLWEMNVIEGLDNIDGLPKGCFAILLKIHHTMIDGKAGAELINILHDLEPVPANPPGGNSGNWVPEESPSSWKLTQKAVKNLMFRPGHSLRIMARTVPSLISHRDTRKTKVPFRVPNTPFNQPVTTTRVVDSCFFPLDDLKSIRKLVPGSTINDIAIAIISGALRKYLLAKKQLPNESLVAMVPISVRSEAKSEGNELTAQSLPICTNIADPVERLQKIMEISQDAKGYVQAVGAKKLSEMSTALPGRVTGLLAHAMARVALMSGSVIAANTLITNVPGVQVPLYMTGAKMVRQSGAGPLSNNMGLSNFICSYCGEVQIGFTACRDLMPDPEVYNAAIQKSYDEYMDLVRKQEPESTTHSVKKAGKSTK